MPIKARLSLPSSAEQGRENIKKGSWVKISTGSSHSPFTIKGKTNSTWKKIILYQSNQSGIRRNKVKS